MWPASSSHLNLLGLGATCHICAKQVKAGTQDHVDQVQLYLVYRAGDKGRLACLRTAEMVALGTFPDLSVYKIMTTSKGVRKQWFAIACQLDSAGRRRGQTQAAAPESIEDYLHRMRKLHGDPLTRNPSAPRQRPRFPSGGAGPRASVCG